MIHVRTGHSSPSEPISLLVYQDMIQLLGLLGASVQENGVIIASLANALSGARGFISPPTPPTEGSWGKKIASVPHTGCCGNFHDLLRSPCLSRQVSHHPTCARFESTRPPLSSINCQHTPLQPAAKPPAAGPLMGGNSSPFNGFSGGSSPHFYLVPVSGSPLFSQLHCFHLLLFSSPVKGGT